MFGSTILDVAIGLSFTFLTVALLASALTEAIASILRWRACTLMQGVMDLLNDAEFNGLARNLYNSALVGPRLGGDPQRDGVLKRFRNRPSYIDPGDFAAALASIAQIPGPDMAPERIKARLAVADPQIRRLLEGIVDRTGGDLAAIRAEIARWFDAAMDRVSGAYKRWSQLVSFLLALLIAAALNVSAVHIATVLWQQPLIADAIKPTQDPRAALAAFEKLPLPIGWSRYLAPVRLAPAGGNPPSAEPHCTEWWQLFCTESEPQKKPMPVSYRGWQLRDLDGWGWSEMVGGWLITAFAALFGAPFWFDLLQLIIRLKGTGPSPAEKARQTAAAA